MEHWRHYSPQPQCDDCGRFISYERATLHSEPDGWPTPSPVEYWIGKCAKCAGPQGA